MTGEALLADWLQRLEFRRFEVPATLGNTDDSALLLGEVVTEFEIYFKGKKVQDVIMELRAFGQNYMMASAIRPRNGAIGELAFPGFTSLDLETDILPTATHLLAPP